MYGRTDQCTREHCTDFTDRISSLHRNIEVSQVLLLCTLCGSGVLGLLRLSSFSQACCIYRYARPLLVPSSTCIRFSAISSRMSKGSHLGHGWHMATDRGIDDGWTEIHSRQVGFLCKINMPCWKINMRILIFAPKNQDAHLDFLPKIQDAHLDFCRKIKIRIFIFAEKSRCASWFFAEKSRWHLDFSSLKSRRCWFL